MSVLKQLGILAAIGLAAAGTLWSGVFDGPGGGTAGGSAAGRAAPAREPAPVVVQPVRLTSDAAVVEAIGSGEASRAVMLHTEAAGRVTELLFSAGARVEKGEALLRLDADDERLAVRLARVHLKAARQTMARYAQAAPSGAVSATEVEQARTALSAAQIELAQAELALTQRTLVAPFEGVIGIPQVNVGDRVDVAMPVATLDDRAPLLVEFDVPEGFAYGVEIGGEVTATTWAVPGETFAGVVDSVASRIDPETRTLRVRARFANEHDRLRTGMSFIVRLPLQGERFPSVPSIAVQWDREGAHVWRVRDGKAERVAVRVLKREEQWVLVDAPLAAGDPIVTEGVQRLRPGRAVDVVRPDDAPETGGAPDGV